MNMHYLIMCINGQSMRNMLLTILFREQVEIESKNRTKDIASLLSALIPHIRFPTIPVKIITEKGTYHI